MVFVVAVKLDGVLAPLLLLATTEQVHPLSRLG